MSQILFSVAMCTYNGEKYIKTQIESILNQTVQVDELVICDDCSTDSTWNILSEYSLKYPDLIKTIKNEHGLGAKRNFEKAISLTRNEYIFLSDQDDIWLTHKVEKVQGVLMHNEHIDLLFTDGYLIDDFGHRIENKTLFGVFSFDKEERDAWKDRKRIFDTIMSGNNRITGATSLISRSLFIKSRPFDLPHLVWHDAWLGIISSLHNGVYIIDQPLIEYRLHHNQQVGIGKNNEEIPNLYSILERCYQLNNARYELLKLLKQKKYNVSDAELIAQKRQLYLIRQRLELRKMNWAVRLWQIIRLLPYYFSSSPSHKPMRDIFRDIINPA